MRNEIFVTKTGLLVVRNRTTAFFCDNSGNFRRQALPEEIENLQKIYLAKASSRNEAWLDNLQRLMSSLMTGKLDWTLLWSVEKKDNSNYRPETCDNGGDYSFTTEISFFGRVREGRIDIMKLEQNFTSAEFPYTHCGQFVRFSEVVHNYIINIQAPEGAWVFETRGYRYSKDYGQIVLEQCGEKSSLEEALTAVDSFYASRHDDDGEYELGWQDEKLSVVDIQDRIDILLKMQVSSHFLLREISEEIWEKIPDLHVGVKNLAGSQPRPSKSGRNQRRR